jgi:nucleotide-binding universal stress UspA family protein
MVGKIRNILVPLDGSKNSFRGLEKAITVGKEMGSTITTVYVFHLPWAAGIKLTKSMERNARKKATQIIGTAKRQVERAGLPFKWKTVAGKTGDAIINTAKGSRVDMIVIGARGLGATKEKFLGSTSNYVMHKSTIPVLIVK